MNRIKVINNKGFHWHKNENIYAKGFIYSKDDVMYDQEHLCEYFQDVNTIQELVNRASDANGLFSVIIKLDNCVLAAVDRLRTFPLFYNEQKENQIISDSPEEIISYLKIKKVNPRNKQEFLCTGIVTGKNTLISGLFQIQAGACINFTGNSTEQQFYHSYVTGEVASTPYDILAQEFKEILHVSFNRFVKSLRGRTVLLSLSGGYDSRIIAVMLKILNYDNVICYSYGNPNNKETKISKIVAQRLGYDWQFIDYKKVADTNYINDPIFQKYFPYAANYTSMFFLEQYFAVKYFKDSNTIPNDAIFCAGHSGDFLGGSQLTKTGNIKEKASINEIAHSILKIKYSLNKVAKEDKKIFLENISEYLSNSLLDSGTLAYSVFENWDLKEKLAKFIFNSAVVYDYFGYEHRLPLMDNALFDFFKVLPYKYKLYKQLYDDVLKQRFFNQYNLNFDNELQPTKYQIYLQNIKNKIHPFLPSEWHAQNRNKNDQIYHSEITEILMKDAHKDGYQIKLSGKTFNPIIIQWYLYQVDKRVL